jgi:dephospho-CoA kinase
MAIPFVLGLTGSIGMGKSTVALMFKELAVDVLDSDAVVHDLYAAGGAAVPLIEAAFPGVVDQNGGVSRPLLSARVVGNPAALKHLESIVHPLVSEEKRRFVAAAAQRGDSLVVLDVPLLFETGVEAACDAVAVVSAPLDVQRARVLDRPGMSVEKFQGILARQMTDEEKRKKADFIVDTGASLDETKRHVAALVDALKGRQGRAAATYLDR